MNCLSRLFAAFATLMVFAMAAMASPPLDVGFEIRGGFKEINGQYVLGAESRTGQFLTTKPLPPGYYRFTAEYKTQGFGPLGLFATDVKTIDRSASLSCYEWNGAVGDFSPLVVFFRVETPSVAQVRCGDWKEAKPDATLTLRNLKIEPFKFADAVDVNWLDDGSFDAGQVGFIPTDWFWKYASGKIEEESLVANTSYRSGKHVLRMTGGGEKERMVQSRAFPLPPNGTLELSAWARSDDGGQLSLHIVRDGWGSRSEKRYRPTKEWKKYTVSWPVDAADRKWFFCRMDKDKATTSVELADVRLTWKPSGSVEDVDVEIDPYAEAKAKGWAGAPGANLLYNPDFELGGTGYYYDFSWPKKMAHYETTRRAKPVQLREGKGVDGGTCAALDGTGMRAWSFPIVLGQTYTFSMDVKQAPDAENARCMVRCLDASWHAALWKNADKIPADEWKHYSWTFRWTKANREGRAYIHIGGSGVLVDRIQLVEGTEKEYQAPPVMVGLVYDRWAYFVRGRDKAKVSIKVVPGVKRQGEANILVEAKDAWGQPVWKREFRAPLDKTTIVPVDVPTDRCGTIHVDLTAKVDKKVAGIGVSRYAIIDPAVLQKTSLGKPGLAGVCQESFNFPVWLCEDHAKILTDIGVRLNRFFASVPPDMPLPIPSSFSDGLLAKCRPFREAGIDVIPCIERIIPGSVNKANANTMKMPTPEDLETFGKYIGAYAAALKSEVRYFEIFNEPNLWRVTSGPDKGKRTMGPTKYIEFQKAAYKAIKDVDPKLQVVCNALNNIRFDWIKEWMDAGAGKYMDVFSFHAYGLTNYFDKGPKLKEMMDGYHFDKPLVDTEKYYAADMFSERNGYEETHRGYFLPQSGEMQTAGRSIQFFVTHAAMGVPVCFFHPAGTLSRRGPGDELFVFDFFSAYNAAIRFMVEAGRGHPIELGPEMTAVLFPDAPKGPLVAIWSPRVEMDARMELAGEFAAYDMMGNPYTPEQLTKGIRIAADPTYLRFPAGTAAAEIERALSTCNVLGLGAPFKVDLAVTGPKQVSALVTSLRHRTLDGTVKLLNLPTGWVIGEPSRAFSDLKAGGTLAIPFDFQKIDLANMGTYKATVIAERGEEFVRKDVTLRPVFASPIAKIKADANLSDWKDVQWVELGDANASTKFSQTLGRSGASDLSAKLAVGWSDDAVAIAIVVTDNAHQPAESSGLAWQGDSVQLYFDPKNDATADRRNLSDDVAYTLSLIGGTAHAWIDKGAEGNFKGKANRTEGLEDADVDLAVKRVGNQTIYEAIFSRERCLPDAELKAGSALGFSLLINDNDGKGRKTGVTLAPKGGEPYGHPETYRDLVLQAK